jgi:hypothetical protein
VFLKPNPLQILIGTTVALFGMAMLVDSIFSKLDFDNAFILAILSGTLHTYWSVKLSHIDVPHLWY